MEPGSPAVPDQQHDQPAPSQETSNDRATLDSLQQADADPPPQPSLVSVLIDASVVRDIAQTKAHRQPSVLRLARPLHHHNSFENYDFPSHPAPSDAVAVPVVDEHKVPHSPNSPTVTSLPPAKITHVPYQRNDQAFQGRNHFFCGGRLVTSGKYWAFLITLVLLIAPCVLFGIFTCPFLWRNLHPSVPIVFAYLFVLALASMIKTSWSDPGIIPRGLDDPSLLATDGDEVSSAASSQIPFAFHKEVRIKEHKWTLKYCETCRIYRPPRASHCRQCDNCVENEDHHCIWLNNCIGRRNYRSFFVCITTATLLCIYIIAFATTHVVLEAKPWGQVPFSVVFDRAPVSFCLAIVCFVLLWMVGGLTGYHCFLVTRGVTTHEQLRAHIMKAKDFPRSPYVSGNPLINMSKVLCQPQPKSYLRRRMRIDPVQQDT